MESVFCWSEVFILSQKKRGKVYLKNLKAPNIKWSILIFTRITKNKREQTIQIILKEKATYLKIETTVTHKTAGSLATL